MIIWPTYKCCKMCSRQYTNTECVATEGNWKIAYQSFHRSSEANDENDSVCIDMLFFFHAIYFAFFRQKMVLYEKGKMMVKKLANGEGKYSKDDTECCFIGEIPSTGLVDVTNAVMTRLRNMRAGLKTALKSQNCSPDVPDAPNIKWLYTTVTRYTCLLISKMRYYCLLYAVGISPWHWSINYKMPVIFLRLGT